VEIQSQNDTRPNFIFIIADDVSWNDLGCYGSPVAHTPHIDKIASQGMRFDNAFLTASSCSPSRCSMIAGRYPHNTGAAELHSPLPESQIPFPLLLKDAGYYTVQAGKSHFGKPALRCFDNAYEMKSAGVGGEERWVQTLQERPRDKPFFAWFAATDAHRDWQEDQYGVTPDLDQIVVPPYLVDNKETRSDLALYFHEISRWDYYIGEVLKEVEAQGISDHTIIMVLADNGMPFPRAKTRVYDSGMKTPLIIKWPKTIKSNTTSSSLVSVIDLAPTILDIAGVDDPGVFQGKSFFSVLKNPEQPFRAYVYSEHNWHDYEAHERMVRSTRYLYVKNNRANLPLGGPADSKRSGAQHSLDSLRKLGMLSAAQNDNFMAPRPMEELFDIQADPMQLVNIASLPSMADTLAHYRSILQQWSKTTGDNVPDHLTGDGFDRLTGKLRSDVESFNKVPRGEMPGVKMGALSLNTKPGF